MEIGDGRCFATSLSRSPSLFPLSLPCLFVSVSLPARVFTHRPHRTLRPSSCTESVPHTHTQLTLMLHTHPHMHILAYVHIHIYVQNASRVFARSVYHPSILPPLPLFVVLFLLPFSFALLHELRATTYVCPDLKIVRLVPGRSP